MAKTVHNPRRGNVDITLVRLIEDGGLGATTPAQAVNNIGGLSRGQLGVSVAKLDENSWLTLDQLPTSLSAVSIIGPKVVTAGQSAVFTISNYSSFKEYNLNITPSAATSATRVDDTITITTIDNGNDAAAFEINGQRYTFTVITAGNSIVAKPVWDTVASGPVDAVTTNSVFVTEAFRSAVAGGGEDIHYSTTWQLSEVSDFSVLTGSLVSQVALLSVSISSLSSILTSKGKYYLRVKHRAVSLGDSAWSDTLTLTAL